MPVGTRARALRFRIALRDGTGAITPGHRYGTWSGKRLTKALKEAGFDLETGRQIAAGALRDGCEAYLDHATADDVIALYEFAERAIDRPGGAACISVDVEEDAAAGRAA